MTEHRWRDITGPSVGDDPDWAGRGVASPTFGSATAASLTTGVIVALAPKHSTLMVWFEIYDGQGAGAAPVTPTPVVTATLEVLSLSKDLAGNEVWSVGAVVAAVVNQRRTIEVELSAQGLHFVRLSSLAGALPDPGSIRIFADEAVST